MDVRPCRLELRRRRRRVRVRSNNGLGNRIDVRLTRLHTAVSHFVPRSSGYALTTSRRKYGIMDLERTSCCYSFNSGINCNGSSASGSFGVEHQRFSNDSTFALISNKSKLRCSQRREFLNFSCHLPMRFPLALVAEDELEGSCVSVPLSNAILLFPTL